MISEAGSPSPTVTITPLHMQCQTATITDDEGSVSGVIEFGVNGQFLIWENDFVIEQSRREKLLKALTEYIKSKGYDYEVFSDESRIP